MVGIPSFTTMRSKEERIEASPLTPRVERRHIRKDVVNPVSVRGVLFGIPLFRYRKLAIQPSFHFALVVDTIETNHSLQKDVEFGMAGRVLRDFKQWLENVPQNVLEILHGLQRLVQSVQSRDLYEPTHVMGKEFVVNNPSRKIVPLIDTATVDTDAPFDLHTKLVGVEDLLHRYSPSGICSTPSRK